jgi:hypothetical protein
MTARAELPEVKGWNFGLASPDLFASIITVCMANWRL